MSGGLEGENSQEPRPMTPNLKAVKAGMSGFDARRRSAETGLRPESMACDQGSSAANFKEKLCVSEEERSCHNTQTISSQRETGSQVANDEPDPNFNS